MACNVRLGNKLFCKNVNVALRLQLSHTRLVLIHKIAVVKKKNKSTKFGLLYGKKY